jgi:hypothetical protein
MFHFLRRCTSTCTAQVPYAAPLGRTLQTPEEKPCKSPRSSPVTPHVVTLYYRRVSSSDSGVCIVIVVRRPSPHRPAPPHLIFIHPFVSNWQPRVPVYPTASRQKSSDNIDSSEALHLGRCATVHDCVSIFIPPSLYPFHRSVDQ